jgi:uncharacterized SAM-binding protein YcdF (DUF218 family)
MTWGAVFLRPRGCGSIGYAIIFVLTSLAAGGWLIREPLAPCAANLWIVSDPVSRATAIVVLGGGLETRPFVAAELWRRGHADKILISQAPEERAGRSGSAAVSQTRGAPLIGAQSG